MDKKNVTNLKIVWDCEFYYRLITGFIKANDSSISTLLSSIILRECTVFVREMSTYVPDIEEVIMKSCSKLFTESYQIIRDRIHYFISKPFNYIDEKSIAEKTIRGIQVNFLTRPVDDMSSFRYDLSYIKVENMIYASSIDIYSLLKGTPIEKNGCIIGTALRQYCKDLSSIIASMKSGYSNSELSEMINLDDLILNDKDYNVKFFDGKFDVAVDRTGFSEYLTIILLRFLNDIGSLTYIVKKLFNCDWIETYYLYFFTRLIAIRFDEISDAIYKIDSDFPTDDSTTFIALLRSKNIYPFPEELRLIAKKLRNSIHYNSSSEIWNIDLSRSFYWYDNFLKQGSTNNSVLKLWPNDYLIIKDKMLAHLELLHEWLAEIFDHKLKLVN